jgi:hypothetical protein
MKVAKVEQVGQPRIAGGLYVVPVMVTLPEIPGLDFGKALQVVLAWARRAVEEIDLPSACDDVEDDGESS